MKFTVGTRALAETAALAARVAARKSTKRVYGCVRIEAGPDSLTLSATDFEVSVRHRLRHVVSSGTGEVVVPAQKLADMLKRLPSDEVSGAVSGHRLIVAADGSRFRIEGEDPAEFPEIPAFPSGPLATVSSADLRRAIRTTRPALSKTPGRWALNAMQFVFHGERAQAVAIDGRRLAVISVPCATSAPVRGHALVGKSCLDLADRLLAIEEDAKIGIDGRHMALRIGDAEAYMRQIEGAFPDWKTLLRGGLEHEVRLPSEALAAAVLQASTFTGIDTIAVAFEFEGGELRLQAAGVDGRADVQLPAPYEGPPVRFGLNPLFVRDAIASCACDEVLVSFTNANSIVEFGSPDDPHLRCGVGPIALKE